MVLRRSSLQVVAAGNNFLRHGYGRDWLLGTKVPAGVPCLARRQYSGYAMLENRKTLGEFLPKGPRVQRSAQTLVAEGDTPENRQHTIDIKRLTRERQYRAFFTLKRIMA
eukprot:TRINITY_DN33984_c0_g1_i2.p1 TRINITY_DN33984_c0_g1~~TRINITY_DN33984_c0_g1_i2.p1  ORF type:complete len:110 (+),score=11.07 TRINITY_DN33984_c0_g1_i2:103-432(+)